MIKLNCKFSYSITIISVFFVPVQIFYRISNGFLAAKQPNHTPDSFFAHMLNHLKTEGDCMLISLTTAFLCGAAFCILRVSSPSGSFPRPLSAEQDARRRQPSARHAHRTQFAACRAHRQKILRFFLRDRRFDFHWHHRANQRRFHLRSEQKCAACHVYFAVY